MSLRQKVRRVFQRTGSRSKSKDNGIKIEYYKRHEIPRSKFKGPFDREHQKKLAAWSFEDAQAERPRSLDLSLSPCTTLPDHLQPRCNDDDDVAPDQIVTPAPEVTVTDGMWDLVVNDDLPFPTRHSFDRDESMSDSDLTIHRFGHRDS
ncbi:hypothetical protein P170DRAFT_435287 [Aspergillus steynii IBT 23096]|uniref:Uncharacterized protein n=1 Tax=Aspergillus steynii IBT 23096 TaxID=1392250 RepID=A0A2I2GB15_9EURO|nr:uncharacterized protein P170DRAFT_435287 [Aspergillus steynii IBT 23096]PLB50073.1 hypothetical protein P170DRAFT_435287 [Aspergillus steynii IBT 23096]